MTRRPTTCETHGVAACPTCPPVDQPARESPEAIASRCLAAGLDDVKLDTQAIRRAIAQAITAERAYWQARLAAEEAKTAGWWE